MGSVKQTIISLAEIAGIFTAVKYAVRNKPVILMYHRFGKDKNDRVMNIDIFEQQIAMLTDKFNIISMSDLIAHQEKRERIPKNSVIITIDDGYSDFYDFAFPILKKYQAPAILYATHNFVDGSSWMWPDKVEHIVNLTSRTDYSLNDGAVNIRVSFKSGSDRFQAWNDIADYCLTLSEKQKEDYIEELSKELEVPLPVIAPDAYKAASWENIREMSDHNIEIGGHTMTHPKLTNVEDKVLDIEITKSRELLQSATQQEINSFAYPNGTRQDFDTSIKQKVREAGYANAVVGYHDGDLYSDTYELGRYSIDNEMMQFVKTIHGVEFFSTRLRQAR